jgi:hypothetical protein
MKVNGAVVDTHSFQMDVALWQDVNGNMSFPIPRLKAILPLVFSHWNSLKGGSDATTNLLWHCKYSVPVKANQAIVIARMLSLSAVIVHRLLQLSSAKEDLDFYSCLKRYRDSATERYSFKKTLFLLVDRTTKKFIQSATPEAARGAPNNMLLAVEANTPPAAQRISRSQAHVERIDVPVFQTHKTPKRAIEKQLLKMEQKLERGKLDIPSQIVLARTKTCVGYPVWRVGPNGPEDVNGSGSRNNCSHCGTFTHQYCLGCKRWLCDSLSESAAVKLGLKSHVIIASQGKEIHCRNNCFMELHRNSQKATLDDFNAMAQRKMHLS